jgi:hypothetical protein
MSGNEIRKFDTQLTVHKIDLLIGSVEKGDVREGAMEQWIEDIWNCGAVCT